ncbi:hypothetical protein B296_00000618 [Ensete ventricosum]|uniref:Peroxidase n=1 Tax=Ensete ventricosum TaxID=4639 RepID=A0A427A8X4_ENSVE|nr:hypothetical protein B296_00000618 [Ensete ventricosum]
MAILTPPCVLLLFLPSVMVLVSSLRGFSVGELEVGFYSNSCPDAEEIVRGAPLPRLHCSSNSSLFFHLRPFLLLVNARARAFSLFVCVVVFEGCDGSILIRDPDDATLEKKSSNHAGVRGFDVIDRAKARLEAECQGVVSCADIVALAARDAVYLVRTASSMNHWVTVSPCVEEVSWQILVCVKQSRGPYYDVPTGRRDGRVSNVSDASHMPDIRESVAVLRAKFAKKGLSEKDMVLLSGNPSTPSSPMHAARSIRYLLPSNLQWRSSSGAHDRNDGVLLPGGQAVQLLQRRRLRPLDQPPVSAGADAAVPGGRGHQRPAAARPRERGGVRHAHTPQHPLRPRGDRIGRQALRRCGDEGHHRLLLGIPKSSAILRQGLRRVHGEDGNGRRAYRLARRGQARLLQIQLSSLYIFFYCNAL